MRRYILYFMLYFTFRRNSIFSNNLRSDSSTRTLASDQEEVAEKRSVKWQVRAVLVFAVEILCCAGYTRMSAHHVGPHPHLHHLHHSHTLRLLLRAKVS